MIEAIHKRLAAWYLAGAVLVGGLTLAVTGDALLAFHAGAWAGGLPAGFLATNYTYGRFPFSTAHPIEGA